MTVMVRAIALLLAAMPAAAEDACCTCLKNGGGAGCADRCTGQSSACQTCVKNGGGNGCADDGRCSCGASGSYCTSDMNNLASKAKSDSSGKSPDGRCYSHVANYIDAVGYGGIRVSGFDSAIPSSYWAEAHQFADYLNSGGHAAALKLSNIQASVSNNPYNAPEGSIVVVRAGTPGTAHPTAGDIAVKGSGDYFWNGGSMGYGGSGNFPSSNSYVLGIYVPLKCHTSLEVNTTFETNHATEATCPNGPRSGNCREYPCDYIYTCCPDGCCDYPCKSANVESLFKQDLQV